MFEDVIFNMYDDLVYISDVDTYELLYMNNACRELCAAGSDEYKGKKCYAVLQNLDAPCPFCNNHLLKEDEPYAWEYTNPVFNKHFSIKDKLTNWNGHRARIELARDITDYKEQVLLTEQKMLSMMKSIPGGVCEVLADGSYKILWYNEHFLELIGYTTRQFDEELKGTAGYVHPDDLPRAGQVMERVRRTGQPAVLEMRIKRRDGRVLTLLTSLSFKPARGDKPATFYSVGINITDYKAEIERGTKALQEALGAAQLASESKGRFLSSMSHEIRTPLNAVIGMVSVAGMALDDKDRLRDCHQKIESSARYLLSLINDILDFSRIESGKLELSAQSFSLASLMADMESLFQVQAKAQGIRFSIESHELPQTAFSGDPLRIKQVLVNLISNALKFTPEGGAVRVVVRRLSEARDSAWMEFGVEDTGIGISPEALERIFDIFEQQDKSTSLRYGGSGLGLSISRQLVELMGGRIRVESESGKGSCFTVCIPLALACQPVLAVDSSISGSLYDFSGKKALVVEDNALNQEIATVLLEAHGFTVILASNGQEAVDIFLASPLGHFDVILMDIRMPVMDGHTAATIIRNLPRSDANMPIIALSANAFEEDRQISLASGMNGHVCKPLDMGELCALLREVLRD